MSPNPAEPRPARKPRSRSDGFLRITKVGLWYAIFAVLVGLAATNTGNNGLFLVVATMAAIFVISSLAAGFNLHGLEVRLSANSEIFANRLSHLLVDVTNSGRLPRWLLVLAIEPLDIDPPIEPSRRRTLPFLLPQLGSRQTEHGQLEIMLRTRGLRRIRFAHVTSLFPIGLFRRGRRYPVELDVLVYPEIFDSSSHQPDVVGNTGDVEAQRSGWGHELHDLREFRQGDDPRGIHWKQSARQQQLIYQQRETEENRRLLIAFDNAVGELETAVERRRFERLVSEAATAALDHLEAGYEVALVTRDAQLPFAAGRRHRLAILEKLALVEAQPISNRPLMPEQSTGPHLALAMGPQRKARVRGKEPGQQAKRGAA